MMDNTKTAVKRQVGPFWLIIALMLAGTLQAWYGAMPEKCPNDDPKCSQGVR